jgi:hypothetical protein
MYVSPRKIRNTRNGIPRGKFHDMLFHPIIHFLLHVFNFFFYPPPPPPIVLLGYKAFQFYIYFFSGTHAAVVYHSRNYDLYVLSTVLREFIRRENRRGEKRTVDRCFKWRIYTLNLL